MKHKSVLILSALSALSMGYSDELSSENNSEANVQEKSIQKEIAWGVRSRKNSPKPKLGEVQESYKDQDTKQDASTSNSLHNYNDITKKGGWFNAEFLYWQPSTSGITVGLLTETAHFLGSSVATNPKEHHISYDYFPGFRAGFGCRLPYDHWDLSGQWTQLKAHGRKNLHATEEKIVLPTWFTIFDDGLPSSIRAKGNIDLKIADLELGKIFYVSRPFSLRPSIGARGVRIRQGIKLDYVGTTVSTAIGEDHLHLKNHYLAGGLRGALAAQWNFPYGWAFYSKTGMSLLWGRFKASIHDRFVGTSLGSAVEQPYSQTNTFNAVKSAFDLAAGISWSKVFSQRVRLSFNLGYEFNFFPNQEEIKLYNGLSALDSVVPSKQSGDLGFQGLNAGARIDF